MYLWSINIKVMVMVREVGKDNRNTKSPRTQIKGTAIVAVKELCEERHDKIR